MSISDTDSSAQGNQTSIEEERARLQVTLKEFIEQNPRLYVELVCESVLGIDHDGNNPFVRRMDPEKKTLTDPSQEVANIFASTARLLLDEIRTDRPQTEFSPFSSIIGDNMDFHLDSIKYRADLLAAEGTGQFARHSLFGILAGEIGNGVDVACRHVFEGCPLYRKSQDALSYEMISTTDPLFVHIYKKGEFFETGDLSHLPSWVEGLFFRETDLDLHNNFYSFEPTDDDIAQRRTAMHRILGLASMQFTPESASHTGATQAASPTYQKLQNLIKDFPAQYPDHEAHPPKIDADVRVWMKNERACSDREASVFGSIIAELFSLR
jgi:hypothetical protein